MGIEQKNDKRYSIDSIKEEKQLNIKTERVDIEESVNPSKLTDKIPEEHDDAPNGLLKTYLKSEYAAVDSFGCNKCGYKTEQKSKLKRHIDTVHEQIRNYKCNECGFAFGRKDSLTKHVNRKHSNKTYQ